VASWRFNLEFGFQSSPVTFCNLWSAQLETSAYYPKLDRENMPLHGQETVKFSCSLRTYATKHGPGAG
jgi:hypothetical protein